MSKPYLYRDTWCIAYYDEAGTRRRKVLSRDRDTAFELYEQTILPCIRAKQSEILHSLVASSVSIEAIGKLAAKRVESIQSRVAIAKILTKLASVCAQHKMPDVPPPAFTAREVAKMAPFAGVYFAWEGNWCTYVGESTCIPKRLRKHDVVGINEPVSFIPIADHRRAEHFYVWLLNPPKNKRIAQRCDEGSDAV